MTTVDSVEDFGVSVGPLLWPIRCPLHPKVELDEQGECPACWTDEDTRFKRSQDT